MSYPSSLSDYWHSLQWSSLTASIPTDPRACLSSFSASTFCCLPYLPFWPFSRLADYDDVDDDISTSSSTWQPPPSALSSFSSASAASQAASSFPAASSASSAASSSASSSLYRAAPPVAHPVFSSHLASATFSSPDQLASLLAMKRDDDAGADSGGGSRRDRDGDRDRDRGDKDRRRKEDRAAHAMASDMRTSRDSQRSPKSHSNTQASASKKRSHREKGRDADKKRRDKAGEKESNRALNAPRSALSSSPPPRSHQDEDMSDSDLSSDDERELSVDRHERALVGSVSRPAAIY